MTRKKWEINPAAWHARIYRFWTRHAEFKRPDSGYRENLCHYTRVVLFWGPLSYFLHGPEDSSPKWWQVFAAPLPFVVLWLLVRFVDPTALLTIFWMCALTAFVVMLALLAADNSARVRRWLSPLIRLAEFFKRVGLRIGRSIYETVLTPLGHVLSVELWFWWLRPWQFVLVALTVAAGFLFPTATLQVILTLLCIAVGVAVAAGSVYLHERSKEKKALAEDGPKSRPVMDTFHLAKDIAVSKKHKICPLIEVAE